MGKRVHIAKKYVIKWSDSEGFNWKNDEFKDILRTLNCDVCAGEEGYDDDWEVPVEDYKRALDFIRTHKKEIRDYENAQYICENPECELEDVYDAIMDASGETNFEDAYKYVLKMMRAFWKERDKKCGYMHFSAW